MRKRSECECESVSECAMNIHEYYAIIKGKTPSVVSSSSSTQTANTRVQVCAPLFSLFQLLHSSSPGHKQALSASHCFVEDRIRSGLVGSGLPRLCLAVGFGLGLGLGLGLGSWSWSRIYLGFSVACSACVLLFMFTLIKVKGSRD